MSLYWKARWLCLAMLFADGAFFCLCCLLVSFLFSQNKFLVPYSAFWCSLYNRRTDNHRTDVKMQLPCSSNLSVQQSAIPGLHVAPANGPGMPMPCCNWCMPACLRATRSLQLGELVVSLCKLKLIHKLNLVTVAHQQNRVYMT